METRSRRPRNIRLDLRRSGSNGIERRIVVGVLTEGELVTVIADKWAVRSEREVSGTSWGGQFVSSLAILSSRMEVATSLRGEV